MNKIMTSEERLKTSLNHKEPDRVPFDLSGTETSGISIVALERWLNYKHIPHNPIEVFSLVTQLGKVEEKILKDIGVDTRCLRTLPPKGGLHFWEDKKNKYFKDEWEIIWRMPKDGGFYYDLYKSPLSSFSKVEEIKMFSWPNPNDSTRYRYLKEEFLEIKHTSKAGIVLERNTGGIFETSWWMRGMENFLMDMISNPLIAESILDEVLCFKMVYWEKALKEIGDQFFIVAEADDIAGQFTSLVSPKMYRKYLKPRHTKLFSYIKKIAPNVKIFFHSCGAVYNFIPDFIKSGVDILNPIQVSAAGMDTKKLKKEFGKDIVFWGGGIDTQKILPKGNPKEVKDEVKRRISDLAPGGGFVFSPVHCIQRDVPPENIEAMIEALQNNWKY